MLYSGGDCFLRHAGHLAFDLLLNWRLLAAVCSGTTGCAGGRLVVLTSAALQMV